MYPMLRKGSLVEQGFGGHGGIAFSDIQYYLFLTAAINKIIEQRRFIKMKRLRAIFESILTEAKGFTKAETRKVMDFITSSDFDRKFPEYKEIKILNVIPDSFETKKSRHVVVEDELNDHNIKDVVGIIKGHEQTLNAYKNVYNKSLDCNGILEDIYEVVTGGNTKTILAPVARIVRKQDGTYEYSYSGKTATENESIIDQEGYSKIILDSTLADMWHDIPEELNQILNRASSVTEIKTEYGIKEVGRYKVYSTGKENTKTNFSLADIMEGRMLEEFNAYEVADNIIVDEKRHKYMSISNKQVGSVQIGSIKLSEMLPVFRINTPVKLSEMFGIELGYMGELKKLMVSRNPIVVRDDLIDKNARIVDEETLSNFLYSLTSTLYRFGYVMIRTTKKDSVIIEYHPVRKDYVSKDCQVIGARFTRMTDEKVKNFKLGEPGKGHSWTLGFEITFKTSGGLYIWKFRDKDGKGTLNYIVIENRKSFKTEKSSRAWTGSVLNEGGNAKTKEGISASKVRIGEMDKDTFESYRLDMLKLVVSINRAFRKQTGKRLFSDSSVTDFSVFSGSGKSFFERDYEEYTRVKPLLGDIDVQIDLSMKQDIREFLSKNKGNTFNGFKYIGSQYANDLFNIFEVPEKYSSYASNIQIDFEFVEYDKEGKPNEFDTFVKNSDWKDMSIGIKGLAKNELIPCIYKVIYRKDGVLFQNKKDKPSSNQHSGNFPSLSFGNKGSRTKYRPVLDSDGKQVKYDGKPAYREYDVKDTGTNKDLNKIFEEMFGHQPSSSEKHDMYTYQGMLKLMDSNYDRKTIQDIYDVYVPWVAAKCDDVNVFRNINSKFKEVFPFVKTKLSNDEIMDLIKG